MGYIAHDAVIVTFGRHALDREWMPDVEAFRQSLPEEWRPLVVGPVDSITNGYVTWMFLPDGSKSGWDTDEQGDEYRQQFIDLFSFRWPDGSSPWDVVTVTYGADHRCEFDEQPVAVYAR